MEKLDSDILRWIVANNSNDALAGQLAAASVTRRDYTRTGFFIYLAVPETLPLVDAAFRPVCPDIAAPELLDGAGTSLFCRDGRLHYLELYARGGFFPESLDIYQLSTP